MSLEVTVLLVIHRRPAPPAGCSRRSHRRSHAGCSLQPTARQRHEDRRHARRHARSSNTSPGHARCLETIKRRNLGLNRRMISALDWVLGACRVRHRARRRLPAASAILQFLFVDAESVPRRCADPSCERRMLSRQADGSSSHISFRNIRWRGVGPPGVVRGHASIRA